MINNRGQINNLVWYAIIQHLLSCIFCYYCFLARVNKIFWFWSHMMWMLYLLEAEEDLSQLSLHTESWLHRPPMDPVLLAPAWWPVTAERGRKGKCEYKTWSDILVAQDLAICFPYLDLQELNTLRRVAKSFMLPVWAASSICFFAASFCLSGWPTGEKRRDQ